MRRPFPLWQFLWTIGMIVSIWVEDPYTFALTAVLYLSEVGREVAAGIIAARRNLRCRRCDAAMQR